MCLRNDFKSAKTRNDFETFFNIILQDALIAGGSIVYALNPSFVPIESVGDIDIFVYKKEFQKVFDAILCFFGENNVEIHVLHPYKKGTESNNERDETRFVYLNLHTKDCAINFQIIYMNELYCPCYTVRYFDIDAVQCGIYKRALIISNICFEAHKTRKIRFVANNVKFNRVRKIVNKGFQYGQYFASDFRNEILPSRNTVVISRVKMYTLKQTDDENAYTERLDNDLFVDLQNLEFVQRNFEFFNNGLSQYQNRMELLQCKFIKNIAMCSMKSKKVNTNNDERLEIDEASYAELIRRRIHFSEPLYLGIKNTCKISDMYFPMKTDISEKSTRFIEEKCLETEYISLKVEITSLLILSKQSASIILNLTNIDRNNNSSNNSSSNNNNNNINNIFMESYDFNPKLIDGATHGAYLKTKHSQLSFLLYESNYHGNVCLRNLIQNFKTLVEKPVLLIVKIADRCEIVHIETENVDRYECFDESNFFPLLHYKYSHQKYIRTTFSRIEPVPFIFHSIDAEEFSTYVGIRNLCNHLL